MKKREFIAWVLMTKNKMIPLKKSKEYDYAFIALTKKSLENIGPISKNVKPTRIKCIEI